MPDRLDSPHRRSPGWRVGVVALLVLVAAASAYALLRTDGSDSPEAAGTRTTDFTIASQAVGDDLATSVIVPEGARDEPGPLLVFLHGLGGSDRSFIAHDAFLEALADLGPRAPIVAFPHGRDSFWRNRPTGAWATYVIREVVPEVADRFGADPRRVAIGGLSMGGFGAYSLALRHPSRFCAVGGHSPALWLSFEEAYPEAFDDAREFRRDDLIATVGDDPDAFGDTPVWIDTGLADPFVRGIRAFGKALRRGDADLTFRVGPGGHDLAYWDRHWDDYLRFYSGALADC